MGLKVATASAKRKIANFRLWLYTYGLGDLKYSSQTWAIFVIWKK